MPRSTDGRWTAQCKVCGETFHQRRVTQVVCSVACRGKLPHNTGGVRPKMGLAPIDCPVCGVQFTPMRETQLACSRACYRQTPSWRESQRRQDARPERRARQHDLRRVADAADDRRLVIQEYNFRYNLKSKYNLTTEQHDEMLAAQNGLCALCGNPPDPNGVRAASRLHVDHDHLTGAVRALLCNVCNQGLGHFRDDPDLLIAAAEYIKRYRAI
jgi:Recombination endonuclease VII